MTGPAWLPAAAGAMLGTLYAGLNRAGMRRFWRAPHTPLCVVVTGGTKGIGKALAREFLQCVSCLLAADASNSALALYFSQSMQRLTAATVILALLGRAAAARLAGFLTRYFHKLNAQLRVHQALSGESRGGFELFTNLNGRLCAGRATR